MADDPYSRVYHSVVTDEKFATVYHDDAAFATWTRLLMIADAAWPAPAAIPRRCRKAPLDKLVSVGLVDLAGVDHYRIHGLDAERAKRSEAARLAARARWDAPAMRPHSKRNADPLLDETSKDEKRRDKASQDEKRQAEPTREGATGLTTESNGSTFREKVGPVLVADLLTKPGRTNRATH